MRLYRLPKATSLDDLTLAEADTPKPGRGQVLVHMRAASLNYRDLMVATGRYGRGGSLPPNLVPLSDGAGEVVEIGADVTRVKAGDRVAGIFMQSWLAGDPDGAYAASSLGGAIDGVLAEYRVFDQDGLVHLPDHLSFEQGAALPCAAVTAWNALFGDRPVKPGETVLTLGTGGVSVFAVQFARAAGARIISTSSSDEKLGQVRDLGASETINYKARPDWDAEVKRLTDGRGVDHVVEVGGSGTFPRSVASTRFGGHVHLIGVLTKGEIDPAIILRGGVVVRGIYVGSREMFEAMNRAISVHQIEPVIDRVFGFEAAPDAYRHLESGSHFGKVVIRIGD